ncbi:MAG TPA: hypothetical protein VGP82_25640 [Ktedonobacterales bacterium]|nr:hypothetical protein [Ktedonobacterales bacterium]
MRQSVLSRRPTISLRPRFVLAPSSSRTSVTLSPAFVRQALEQQALERWKLQKEAQIEQMMRDGTPLGAVAAALASPETAERIAVLEAATAGGLSAIDAARLNVGRAGHDLALLDGLATRAVPASPTPPTPSHEEEVDAKMASPLPMAWQPIAPASPVTARANGHA